MIFIGGISSGTKQIEYLRTVICSRCGAYGRYQVFMTYMYFSFFFIPLFKWNRRYYVKMSCCGAVYELEPEVGQKLLRGADIEIREENLTLCRDGSGNPWAHGDASYPAYARQEHGALPGYQGKRCQECGYETMENFSYCPKCGNSLEDMEERKER